MRKPNIAIVVAVVLGLARAAAAGNWADDRAMPAPEYARSKAICRGLKNLPLPRADGPDRAAAAALKGCSSEALYSGSGCRPTRCVPGNAPISNARAAKARHFPGTRC